MDYVDNEDVVVMYLKRHCVDCDKDFVERVVYVPDNSHDLKIEDFIKEVGE